MALTKRRKLFIEEYLECWNGSEAARRAGYAHPGVEACRLLKNAEIQEAINDRLAEKCMSADEVLLRLADMARGDIRDFVLVGEKGSWTIDWETVKGKTHIIKKAYDTKHGLSFELYDAQAALEKIGRAHGIFKSVHEHTGKDGGKIEHEHSLGDDELIAELIQLLDKGRDRQDQGTGDS